MARDTQDFTIGQCIRTTGRNCHLMMSFPPTNGRIHTTSIPRKFLTTPPRPMSTAGSSAFTSPFRTLPGCTDHRVRESHFITSFLQRKLTKRGHNSIMTLYSIRRANRWFCSQPSVVPATDGFVFTPIFYHKFFPSASNNVSIVFYSFDTSYF